MNKGLCKNPPNTNKRIHVEPTQIPLKFESNLDNLGYTAMDAVTGHCVRIGDYICLYSDEAKGYIYNDDTSVKNNHLKVYNEQTVDGLNQIPDVQVVAFQLITANRYQLTKRYRKLKRQANDDSSQVSESALKLAQMAVDAEEKDNLSEQRRVMGLPIRYGDILQLKHVFSNNFVATSTTESSVIDKNKMTVNLISFNSKHAQFKILPRYKVKSEGDLVELEDLIVLESVKTPGVFLHVSLKVFSEEMAVSEVNCGIELSTFTLYRHFTPQPGEDIIRGGSVIQIFHKSLEAYMNAEASYAGELKENAHLRVRAIDQLDPKTFYPPRNTNTFWKIVLENSVISGKLVNWDTKFHLMHMTSRRFLSFDEEGAVTLVTEASQDTLFEFWPLLHDPNTTHVHFNQTIRMNHQTTGGWVQSSAEFIYGRHSTQDSDSLEGIEWDKAELLSLKQSSERLYPDAFVLRPVDQSQIGDYNYITGLFPFIRGLLRKDWKTKKQHGMTISAKDSNTINETFEQLKNFISADMSSEVVKARQHTLRQTKLADLLVDILRLPMVTTDRERLLQMFRRIYDIIYVLTSSRSNSSLLYYGRFLSVFEAHLLLQGDVGLQCCLTVTELMRNNRKVIDRIPPVLVKRLISILMERKSHQFLDMMGVLCICNGLPIVENQGLIAETMILTYKASLYQLRVGHDQKSGKDILVVSMDDGQNWLPLCKFLDPANPDYCEEQTTFFMKQMELYKQLCSGRNKAAISLVTERRGVLTWEVALLGVRSEQLPYTARRMFCELISVLFLQAEHGSLFSKMSNNYMFSLEDNVAGYSNNEESATTNAKRFQELKKWIKFYFHKNPKLVASQPDRNLLTSDVIEMVTSMVEYGIIHKQGEVQDFLTHISSYMIGHVHNPPEFDLKLIAFQFKKPDVTDETLEDTGIIEAKLKCIGFLDILVEKQMLQRMKYLISTFKAVEFEMRKPPACFGCDQSVFSVLHKDSKNVNLWKNSRLQSEIRNVMQGMKQKADYLGKDIVDTLFTMLAYKSDAIRKQALYLLDRIFSSTLDVLTKATEAQLIVSRASTRVLRESLVDLPALRKMSKSKMNEEGLQFITDTMDNYLRMFENVEGKQGSKATQNIFINNGMLDILLNILTHEDDSKIQSRHEMLKAVTGRCLMLLQCLVQDNPTVQTWMFGKLDVLLSTLSQCEQERIQLLVKTFRGKPLLCGKITRKDVRKIVHLCGKQKEKMPGWLDVLAVLVKDPESGLVIKRNQVMVMKALMESFTTTAYPLDLTEERRCEMLTDSAQEDHKVYLQKLVHLLCMCAEGDNEYIESLCQKLVSIPEILAVLNHPDVDLHTKRVYGRFLGWVYLITTRSAVECGTDELAYDKNIWIVLENISVLFTNVSRTTFEISQKESEVDFLLDAGFLIIKGFFERTHAFNWEDQLDERKIAMQLECAMQEFCGCAMHSVTSEAQLGIIHTSLISIRTALDTDGTKCGVQIRQVQRARQELQHKKQREAETVPSEESELNRLFHRFSELILQYTAGQNTVASQRNKKDQIYKTKEYTTGDVDALLPLGSDFQQFVSGFVKSQQIFAVDVYRGARHLILQLKSSYEKWPSRPPKRQEELDLKCLQVLRAMIHNIIVSLPDEWENNPAVFRGTLAWIKATQDALDRFGIVGHTLPLMGRKNPKFGKQVLHLMSCLLFNANRNIQNSSYEYFTDTKEETFFLFIRHTLDSATQAMKERRYIESQKSAPKLRNKMLKSYSIFPKTVESEFSDEMLRSQSAKYDLDVVLRVTEGLCDGQNTQIQDYFLRQPDNLKSVNVLAKVAQFVGIVYTRINTHTIDVASHLFSTLHEMCEGNSRSRDALLNNKIVDYLNLVLRKADFEGCSAKQVILFREEIGCLLYSLIEENGDEKSCAKSVAETISMDHIKYIMTLCYAVVDNGLEASVLGRGLGMQELQLLCSKARFDRQAVPTEVRARIQNLGFLFYYIVVTLFDINPKMQATGFAYPMEEKAFKYFKERCKTIEILKDDVLHRKHFRVKNADLVRDEIKQAVKWDIDRSSPSSKLRDLLMYSQSILRDIDYQKKLHKNFWLAQIANNWSIWNMLCILLSFIINILMLVTWQADDAPVVSDTGNETMEIDFNSKPEIVYVRPSSYDITIYVLGSIHCVCSFMLLLCYFLLSHPTLPKLSWIKSIISRGKATVVGSKTPKNRSAKHLEVHLISMTTLYYLVAVLCSILGTLYYGYFFSFHLFGIVSNNQLLKGVIKAVTLNGKSLIWVAILGVIVLYVYSLITFAFFRSSLTDAGEETFCDTLGHCFLTVVRYGTIGGLEEKLQVGSGEVHLFLYITLFQVSFFIIFTTIGLNIIFGIIVDTFSEIRDRKWIAEKDMRDFCFICSKESHLFEHHAKGFHHHVHQEHSMWAYVFYFIYLHEREENNYTALDMHVAKDLLVADTCFFPMNRALSLSKVQEEDNIERQMKDVLYRLSEVQHKHEKQDKKIDKLMHKLDEMTRKEEPESGSEDSIEVEDRRMSVFMPIDEQVEDSIEMLEEMSLLGGEASRTSSVKKEHSSERSVEGGGGGNVIVSGMFEEEGDQEATFLVESDEELDDNDDEDDDSFGH